MSDAWETDLGQWALAWRDYLRGGANSPEIPDGSVESAGEAFAREIALAHEVCQDQVDADAVVVVSLPPVTLPFGGDGG